MVNDTVLTRRRIWLAIIVSLGLHGLAGAILVGSSVWDAWRGVPVDIEISGMSLDDLRDLPLGTPASGDNKGASVEAPPPIAPPPPKVAAAAQDREERAKAKPAREHIPAPEVSDPDGGAAPPRPTSVRSYAPQGSRVTALMRIDRLRGTPYESVVDGLLMHLPDRRDLLEGTGVDLYRDIDAILIATPNPLDARVTFLAARHRLTDAALRAALERGARATGRKLAWRTEGGRPFAERRSASGASTPGNRDQRLLLLAAPHLVVVTPPAYRSLILRGRGTGARLAGAGGMNGSAADARIDTDGGAGGGAGPARDDGDGWAALLRRIDAEDSVLPSDAVAMISAVDVFSARGVSAALNAVPATRGAVDDVPVARASATVMGLPAPRMLTATLGVAPEPFADLLGEFADPADALRWEQEWPSLRRKFLNNPLVVVTGFAGLIARATLARSESNVRVHIDATAFETTRILELLSMQMTMLGR